METLNELYTNITKFWSTPSQCVLRYVTYALPSPISVNTGDKRYTEDRALVRLHREKINWKDSRAIPRSRVVSLLYLGSKI